MSEFMVNYAKELVDKKSLAESTAAAYMRTLYILNDKKPFKNLAFLRKKEDIIGKINAYADSTQRSMLAAIVTALSVADKQSYKSIQKFYQTQMLEKVTEAKKIDAHDKTDKQKDNWIDWKDVENISVEQHKLIKDLSTKKTLTTSESDKLLQALVLSLYVCIPPRRNQDYLDMVVTKKWKESDPHDVNYLDLAGEQFVFNKYKTAKKYGVQKVAIPESLMDVLVVYLKHQTLYKAVKGKTPVPFLVVDDKPLKAVNAITRILNRIFGKKVGSSMLRHIFLSNKYEGILEEQTADSEAMGHSLNQQRDYIKHE
jgi:integrase